MFLPKLDFLSSPPQMYFLRKRTNKTLFGGILFIIYIFIMLNIFIVYTLDFFLNDRYNIRYSLYKNFTENNENNKMEELNPHLNFSFDLKKVSKDLKQLNLSEQFMILGPDWSIIERNSILSRNPDDLSIMIV